MNKKDFKDSHAKVCLSRLTRILNLDMLEDLQQLEHTGNVSRNLEVETNLKPHRSFFSKSSDKINKIMNRKGGHRMFGHPLTEDAVQRICILIEFLKSHQSKEGLFRISGSKKRQEELKDLLDKDEHVDFNSSRFTPHDVASVFKNYLAELPEPLLTEASHDAYIQITEIRNDESSSKLIEALQLLFLLLPPQNRLLLQQLLELLNLVAKDQQNKMTAYNLAVVFSPNIMAYKTKLACLSRIPDDISVMHKLVAAMIHHAKELFKIPKGLREELEVTEKIFKKGSEEIPVMRTFCQQMDQLSHKQTVQQATSDALVQLYNHVIDMSDGPVKQTFLDRFEKIHPGTPPFMPRSKKLIHREKLEASTPLKSVQSPFSLTGSTMSPISKRQAATRNVDSLACTPALKKRVAFDVVDTPTSFSHDTPLQRKATPFSSRLGASTPSGVMMRPHDSTPVKSKRARTSSVSNLENIPSSNKHLRSCTVHTPSHKRRPCETPFTPSGLISGFMADVSFDDSFTCSSPARHGTPPRIKRRLSEIDYSMEEYV